MVSPRGMGPAVAANRHHVVENTEAMGLTRSTVLAIFGAGSSQKRSKMRTLKLGITNNPRFAPLIDGKVKSDKLDLEVVVTTPPELFYRNLKNDEFDIFEMSLSDFLITREQRKSDRWQWSALPIFPAKAFVWLGLYINTGAGISGLADLRGKRVGIPDYVMTAALWMRVILRELYGIRADEITWFVGRTRDLSHGGLLGLDTRPPADVSLTWLTAAQSFDVMLDRGEIDIAFGFAPRHDPKLFSLNIDRYGGTPLEGNPRITRLFDDGGRAVIEAFFRHTGIVPANHVIVAQRGLLEQHPEFATELFRLFTASKQAAYENEARGGRSYLYFEGTNPARQAALYGDDPYPFGISRNRAMLEMLFCASYEEGLIHKLPTIEEVFFEGTLQT
jgi:4,5-dihydroxyphthalate decarboxylase